MADKADTRITEDTPESQLPLDYVAAYGPEHEIGYMTGERGRKFEEGRKAEEKRFRAEQGKSSRAS